MNLNIQEELGMIIQAINENTIANQGVRIYGS